MLDQHIDSGAGVTVAGIRIRAQATPFGVIETDVTGQRIKTVPRSRRPPGFPTVPDESYVDGQLHLQH